MSILSQKTQAGANARAKVMDKIFTDKLTDRFAYLYSRWQDEKEYEDFKDYISAMLTAAMNGAPEGTSLVKGHKRPFGITVDVPGFPYKVKIAMNKSSVYWEPAK